MSPLEKGDFHLFQIIGCSVVDRSGTAIGRVTDFIFVNENDLLVVESDGKEILIPFVQGICVGIDLRKKEIIIDPPEGLLEINEI
jgi:16S rRNA processing protein RimM